MDDMLRHFDTACLGCSCLSGDVIAQHMSAHLPRDCLKFTATHLIAEFVHVCSADVAAALRHPPVYNVSIDVFNWACRSDSFAPWISLPLDELTRRLERLPRYEDLQNLDTHR